MSLSRRTRYACMYGINSPVEERRRPYASLTMSSSSDAEYFCDLRGGIGGGGTGVAN